MVAGVYNGIGSTQGVFIALKKCPNAVIMCLYVNARMCAFIWPWVCLCVSTRPSGFPLYESMCLVRLDILGYSKLFPLGFPLRCTESPSGEMNAPYV